MKIARKFIKIHVFGKIVFFGWKYAFYPKTKVVPKTWSYCKTDEKVKFSKLLSLGGVRGSWIRSFWAFLTFLGPHRSHPKIIFFENFFIMKPRIPQGYWNYFCFGVKSYFWPPKGSFPKNMDFGSFSLNIHIIKAPNWNCKCGNLSKQLRTKFFVPDTLFLWFTTIWLES